MPEIKDAVNQYITFKNLTSQTDKAKVKLDLVLASLWKNKSSEVVNTEVTKREVNEK